MILLLLAAVMCLFLAACGRKPMPRTTTVYHNDGSKLTVVEDEHGRMTNQQVERPDGSKTSLTYHEDGSQTELNEYPDGSTVQHIYRADGTHTETVTAADGSVIQHEFDENGNRISEEYYDPDGNLINNG